MKLKNIHLIQRMDYLLSFCILLFVILFSLSSESYADETETTAAASGAEASMTRIELPEEVYDYDYYIYFNCPLFSTSGNTEGKRTVAWAKDLVIGFNKKSGYDNYCIYASYAGAYSDAYKSFAFYAGKGTDTLTATVGSSYYYLLEGLKALGTDITVISGAIYQVSGGLADYDSVVADIEIFDNYDEDFYVGDSDVLIPRISVYNTDFFENFYTDVTNGAGLVDEFTHLLNYLYPNGYNVENMSQFKNQINTNLPIFDNNSYAQQYCVGDMTEGWMLTTSWNNTDLVALPEILKDNVIANITGVDKALTTTGEEYVLGLYVDDINKYTEMDFKYSISYYSNDKTLIGSWGDEDVGYIFPTSPEGKYWYNVELKKTVEEAGFTFDLENYYFEGLVTIQFREEFKNSTYCYSNIYKLDFKIDSSGLLVETKQVTVGSNGNANSSVDSNWNVGSSSSGSSFGGTGGSFGDNSSSGSDSLNPFYDFASGGLFSTTLFTGLTSTVMSLGSITSLMASLFSFLPLEISLFIGFGVVCLVVCGCVKAIIH